MVFMENKDKPAYLSEKQMVAMSICKLRFHELREKTREEDRPLLFTWILLNDNSNSIVN